MRCSRYLKALSAKMGTGFAPESATNKHSGAFSMIGDHEKRFKQILNRMVLQGV